MNEQYGASGATNQVPQQPSTQTGAPGQVQQVQMTPTGAPMYTGQPAGAQPSAGQPVQATTSATLFKGSTPQLLLGLVAFGAGVFLQGIGIWVAYAATDHILGIEAIYELFGAGVALVIFAALGGASYLHFDPEKIKHAVRDCWWLLALDVLLVILVVVDAVTAGDTPIKGWLPQFLLVALMCLGIGLCEEGLFRGLLLHSLLAKMGGTKKGIFWATLISAIIFGLFHVIPFEESDLEPLGLIQMVLKVIQTGIIGWLWAVIVIREDDLWGASIVHGLSDFLLIAPDVVFGYLEDALSTEYVTSGDEAMSTIFVYLITIAAYLPLMIKLFKLFGEASAPDFGAFLKNPQVAYASAPVPLAGSAPVTYVPAQPSQQAQTPVQVGQPLVQEPYQQAPQVQSAQTSVQQTPYPGQSQQGQGPVPPQGWGA